MDGPGPGVSSRKDDMAKRERTAAAPLPPEFQAIQFSAEDAAIWRDAIEAREDAIRQAEAAVLRAKLAVSEAVEAQISMVRSMAERYRFDPRKAWTLHDDGRLTPAATPGGAQ